MVCPFLTLYRALASAPNAVEVEVATSSPVVEGCSSQGIQQCKFKLNLINNICRLSVDIISITFAASHQRVFFLFLNHSHRAHNIGGISGL